MKTTINLSDFDFGDRQLVQQISDDPTSGFARVIVFDRFEVLDDIKQISIGARMHFINTANMELMPHFTQTVKNSGLDWNINNHHSNTMIGFDGLPVPNPDYVEEIEVSEENFPYLKQEAYTNFSKIMFALLAPLVKSSVDADDSNNYFD